MSDPTPPAAEAAPDPKNTVNLNDLKDEIQKIESPLLASLRESAAKNIVVYTLIAFGVGFLLGGLFF
jgi:hypothetical protein